MAGRSAFASTSALFGRLSLRSAPEAACSRCCQSTALQTKTFSTTAPALESRRKRIARVKKRSNLEQRHLKEVLLQRSKPDPVLGHQNNADGRGLWQGSKLKGVVLAKDDVWAGKVPSEQAAGAAEQSKAAGPALLNFGLGNGDRKLLFQDLPEVIVEDRLLDSSPDVVDIRGLEEDKDAFVQEEQNSSETLARILDLRNASGKGIQVENIRRIVQAFGSEKGPGSSEAQAAILTYRIRNLHEHLGSARHDNSNRRAMNMLVHQRARILKYYKRKSSPQEYSHLLRDLGLDARAVEGELTLPGKPKITAR